MDTTSHTSPGTTAATIASPADHTSQLAALLVGALLWLATGLASRNRALTSDDGGDDWRGPYTIFSLSLLVAATVSCLAVVLYTSRSGHRGTARITAIALAILGVVSTVMAWAFPLWAVLLAAGFIALALTGRREARHAAWLGAALLVGLGVAIVGVTAELGPAGEYNDYSVAQGWGITAASALAATALLAFALRASRADGTAPAVTPSA